MLDTHCHLNDAQFDNDIEVVVSNFLRAGGDKAICVAWDVASSKKAEQISNKYAQVYYSVGVHPDEVAGFNANELENLIKAAQSKQSKLVAIGEIGLDYFHNKENKAEQRVAFIKQIELANKYHLPIIIHCREAYGDTLEVLKQFAPFKYGAVMHCYSGSLEYANELLRLGVKISFTGTVTYKNAVNVKEVAKNIPLDSFFLETDCPYLAPVPHRGERNELAFVYNVAECVAELRNMAVSDLIAATDSNAQKFFHLA